MASNSNTTERLAALEEKHHQAVNTVYALRHALHCIAAYPSQQHMTAGGGAGHRAMAKLATDALNDMRSFAAPADDEPTITLPFETVERVTDALNALLLDRTRGDATTERGRMALRELATMTSAGQGTAEALRERIASLEAHARAAGDNALRAIADREEYARALRTAAGALDRVLNSSGDWSEDVEAALAEANSVLKAGG